MTTHHTEREAFTARIVSRAWKDAAYRSLAGRPEGGPRGGTGDGHPRSRRGPRPGGASGRPVPAAAAPARPLPGADRAGAGGGAPLPVCPTVTSTAITSPCDCGPQPGPGRRASGAPDDILHSVPARGLPRNGRWRSASASTRAPRHERRTTDETVTRVPRFPSRRSTIRSSESPPEGSRRDALPGGRGWRKRPASTWSPGSGGDSVICAGRRWNWSSRCSGW